MKNKLTIFTVILLVLCFALGTFVSYAQPSFVLAKNIAEGSQTNEGQTVAVDGSGNIYVAGYFRDITDFDPGGTNTKTSAGLQDIFVSKFNPAGNLLWIKQMGGAGVDQPYGIAVNVGGNAYVVGHFTGTCDFNPGGSPATLTTAGGYDAFVCKLDASGVLSWAQQIGGTGNDRAWGIALDGSGNPCITGSYNGTVDFNPGGPVNSLTSAGSADVYVVKWNASGAFQWVYGAGGTISGEGAAIAADGSGNVYVTGNISGSTTYGFTFTAAGGDDVFILKLNSSGGYVWSGAIGSIGPDYGKSIAVDGSGNVLTTGYFDDDSACDFDPGGGTAGNAPTYYLTSAGNYDIFVCKWNSSGGFVWAKRMGQASADYGNGIAADATGDVYTTGYFFNTVDFDPGSTTYNITTNGGADIFISVLDASGNFKCAGNMGSPLTDAGKPAIAVDGSNNIYSSGIFSDIADFDPGVGITNITSAGQGDGFLSILGACPPLPIELFSFIGDNEGDKILLEWVTVSEINNDYFSIERSKDGVAFEQIGILPAAGNSNTVRNYQFIDHAITNNSQQTAIYYRLKQTGFDGQSIYSQVISVSAERPSVFRITRLIVSNLSKTLQINFTLPGKNDAELTVYLYDLTGQKVLEKRLGSFSPGLHSRQVDVSALGPDIYYVKLKAGGQEAFEKLIIPY